MTDQEQEKPPLDAFLGPPGHRGRLLQFIIILFDLNLHDRALKAKHHSFLAGSSTNYKRHVGII